MHLGTDLIYILRLQKVAEELGRRFFGKVLTKQEIEDCVKRTPHFEIHQPQVLARLAARIAVKEAVAKALGTGLNGLGWGQGINWQDVETISPDKQKPYIELKGKAAEIAEQLGIHQWQVSWSHDGDYVSATVIGYE